MWIQFILLEIFSSTLSVVSTKSVFRIFAVRKESLRGAVIGKVAEKWKANIHLKPRYTLWT